MVKPIFIVEQLVVENNGALAAATARSLRAQSLLPPVTVSNDRVRAANSPAAATRPARSWG